MGSAVTAMRLAVQTASLADIVRIGLPLVVVEDEAEIRTADRNGRRIPINGRRIVGHGYECPSHAGGSGAERLKALCCRRMWRQLSDNECEYGARQRSADSRQLSVPKRSHPSVDERGTIASGAPAGPNAQAGPESGP